VLFFATVFVWYAYTGPESAGTVPSEGLAASIFPLVLPIAIGAALAILTRWVRRKNGPHSATTRADD
jgi:hypothetical protein